MLTYNRRAHTICKWDTLGAPAQEIRETASLGPTGHLLHKAAVPRLGVQQIYIILRSTHRKTTKIRRQRNMSQMKDQDKTPEKGLKKMKASNLPDAEFRTLYKDVQ